MKGTLNKLSDWVKTYEDVVSDDFCNLCILLTENNKDIVDTVDLDWRKCQSYPDFDYSSLFDEYKDKMVELLDNYKGDINNVDLNHIKCIEAPSLVNYRVNDYFNTHSDNWDMNSSTRQLTVILFLNDVEEGGKIVFDGFDMEIKPKRGSVVIFPSYILYNNKITSPVSNDAYSLTSWFHFGGDNHTYRVHYI